jgi:adenylosuccinate lyase
VIARYTRPEMGHIWSDENKFRTWLQVEVRGQRDPRRSRTGAQGRRRDDPQKGDFDLKRIYAIEAEVKHDVIAFTTAVAEKVGPQSRWLHYGLTSATTWWTRRRRCW